MRSLRWQADKDANDLMIPWAMVMVFDTAMSRIHESPSPDLMKKTQMRNWTTTKKMKSPHGSRSPMRKIPICRLASRTRWVF
ncbi:hypothetical protein ASD01_17560 [Ensifer sp. Root423]|nr:hypothetical protein ASD01_17560 [Ensifer sp. Root423]KQX52567.1 hypothetical protein ASD49_30350 [Ensifer sp. Root1298]KQX77112.1 hypothetical protein ASD41_34635 [Ensifer sp. Root1312]KRC17397.1 hypothetical protein ASE29_34645 [Ensifer sp. Root74]KRD76462.1 hypothetical protein ASE71_17530 [Ensifer sp. Root954]OWZ89016.1 hypothetical protein B9J07_35340 [Sinorhizobium sp. LM21]